MSIPLLVKLGVAAIVLLSKKPEYPPLSGEASGPAATTTPPDDSDTLQPTNVSQTNGAAVIPPTSLAIGEPSFKGDVIMHEDTSPQPGKAAKPPSKPAPVTPPGDPLWVFGLPAAPSKPSPTPIVINDTLASIRDPNGNDLAAVYAATPPPAILDKPRIDAGTVNQVIDQPPPIIVEEGLQSRVQRYEN